jgi:hypothetical protein
MEEHRLRVFAIVLRRIFGGPRRIWARHVVARGRGEIHTRFRSQSIMEQITWEFWV